MKKFSPEGFTLLELLIAITIFSVVISTVYGAYRVTFTTISVTENSIDHSLAARRAFICIKNDLEQVTISSEEPFSTIYGGSSYTLSFTTANNLLTSPDDLRASSSKITYQIEEESDTNLITLYRSALPGYLDEEVTVANRWLLAENLSEVRFLYFDKEGDEQEEWNQGEDEENEITLPSMIRVELYFPGEVMEDQALYSINIALPVEKQK